MGRGACVRPRAWSATIGSTSPASPIPPPATQAVGASAILQNVGQYDLPLQPLGSRFTCACPADQVRAAPCRQVLGRELLPVGDAQIGILGIFFYTLDLPQLLVNLIGWTKIADKKAGRKKDLERTPSIPG
jgi:hypothetical protein